MLSTPTPTHLLQEKNENAIEKVMSASLSTCFYTHFASKTRKQNRDSDVG